MNKQDQTMKSLQSRLLTAVAVVAGLLGTANAATVTWGTATAIANNTDIKSTGVTGLVGASFGTTSGTTTTVNNGVGGSGGVDVVFTHMAYNATPTLIGGGITVSLSGYNFRNTASAPATVIGAYSTVMRKHMGAFANGATFTLSGLTIGTQYQIQAFLCGGDTVNNFISGSPVLAVGGSNNAGNNTGFGKWVVGTFTADATSQVFTQTANTGEPILNALTIGVVSGGGDTTPPTISTLSPADNATSVAVGANLVATFDETIALDTGNVIITNLTDAMQTTIAITDATQVSASGAVLTINPTANLIGGKDYAVLIDATAIKDATTNLFVGIADATTWNFTTLAPDITPPTISTLSPADNADTVVT
jgi:Bacterial Ig-like domain